MFFTRLRRSIPITRSRKTAGMRRAVPEMVLAARRTERRKQHLRLGWTFPRAAKLFRTRRRVCVKTALMRHNI